MHAMDVFFRPFSQHYIPYISPWCWCCSVCAFYHSSSFTPLLPLLGPLRIAWCELRVYAQDWRTPPSLSLSLPHRDAIRPAGLSLSLLPAEQIIRAAGSDALRSAEWSFLQDCWIEERLSAWKVTQSGVLGEATVWMRFVFLSCVWFRLIAKQLHGVPLCGNWQKMVTLYVQKYRIKGN